MARQVNKKTCSNCEFFKFGTRGLYGVYGICAEDESKIRNVHESNLCECWKERKNRESDSQNRSVSHPNHYCDGRKYEPYKVIDDWELGFNTGNAVKYIARAGRKPGNSRLQDLEKAKQYLEFEIEKEKEMP